MAPSQTIIVIAASRRALRTTGSSVGVNRSGWDIKYVGWRWPVGGARSADGIVALTLRVRKLRHAERGGYFVSQTRGAQRIEREEFVIIPNSRLPTAHRKPTRGAGPIVTALAKKFNRTPARGRLPGLDVRASRGAPRPPLCDTGLEISHRDNADAAIGFRKFEEHLKGRDPESIDLPPDGKRGFLECGSAHRRFVLELA
jgi:hypothetical protein